MRLRPGGTADISRWWNHRDRVRPIPQPPGLERLPDCSRWFHHRL